MELPRVSHPAAVSMDGFGPEEFPNLPTPPQLDLEPSGTCVPLDQPLVDLLQACFKAAALNKVREDIAEVLKTFGFYEGGGVMWRPPEAVRRPACPRSR